MEENLLALLALCGLFSHSVSLSMRSPYALPRSLHSPSNYKRLDWQNEIAFNPSSLIEQQSQLSKVSDSPSVLYPESLEELRRWWSSIASKQRILPPDSQLGDLGGLNSNFEEDFSDTPQDYNYFYGLDHFSENQNRDEAFRQALKAYILPGNPFLRTETYDNDEDRLLNRDMGRPPVQSISSSDDAELLHDFFLKSYPQEAAKMIKNNESKKQSFRIDQPLQTQTDFTLVSTEVTSQNPVSASPSDLPNSTPISKTKGQKEFAMLRPPSDNVRKFDQWAKSAQDFMKSVASASVRETREARPVSPLSKTEDILSQQLNSLKRRSKRHTPKKFRSGAMRYY